MRPRNCPLAQDTRDRLRAFRSKGWSWNSLGREVGLSGMQLSLLVEKGANSKPKSSERIVAALDRMEEEAVKKSSFTRSGKRNGAALKLNSVEELVAELTNRGFTVTLRKVPTR